MKLQKSLNNLKIKYLYICFRVEGRAQRQRFVALKNAFEIIRAFAEPSLDPEQLENFEELERVLIERYSVSI